MENVQKNQCFSQARELFEDIICWLNSESVYGLQHSDLEKNLWTNGNELLRRLLQGYLDSRQEDEIEEECLGIDEEKRTHKLHHSRLLMTIFGEVTVNRIGYGGRKITSLHPLDGEFNLPAEKYSHGLAEKVSQAVAFNGFDRTEELIKENTGGKIPKRQLEELTHKSAVDFELFYEAQQKQDLGKKTGELMVLTMEGKGVVMRKEDLRENTKIRAKNSENKLKKRLSKGEKSNSKRMATVAAVYTIDPWVRTPQDIINKKESENQTAPKPVAKRVWASLEKEPETVMEEMFAEAICRDINKEKKWVALVDGNKTQLRLLQKLAKKEKIELTIILDLIHVIEYLWKAAYVFYAPSSQEAENWVTKQLGYILEGKSSDVARSMRTCATKKKLTPEQRIGVDKCATYLVNNKAYLKYDYYLAQGFPLATGVIEGACRHLVKDRMDITGARWSLKGAEAILRLRSLCVSGDWKEYWQFHLNQECQRNHRDLYKGGIPLLKKVSSARCSTLIPPKLIIV